jgi:hypothetical protein
MENEMMGNRRSIAMVEPGELGPGKGRKQCKNCSKYVGVRSAKCEHCGTEFPKAALVPQDIQTQDATIGAGKGRKQCPKCLNYVGVRSRACTTPNCNYVFAVKEEPVETHIVASSKGFRSVYTPAGFCPVKLQATTFEAVGEWAEKVLSAGERNQINYLPPALKYFLRHSFEIYSKEWREAETALTEWVLINLGGNNAK